MKSTARMSGSALRANPTYVPSFRGLVGWVRAKPVTQQICWVTRCRAALIVSALALGAFAHVAAAAAQGASDWPRQPIRMVVGFAPGAVNDVQARVVGQKLSERYKQPVVVENRTGAGGNIAAEFAARAPADGYTLFVAPTATLVINPAVYSKLSYDPQKDFAPITQLSGYHLYLTVNASLPVKSVKDLIAYAKANPEKANHAVPATTFQMLAALFEQRSGTKFETLLFKSNAETMTALLNGQAMIIFTDFGNLSTQSKAGKVRGLAIAAMKRNAEMPDIPTLDELGYAGVELIPLTGLVAPRGTPEPIIAKLHADVVDILKQPDVQERFKSVGLFTVGSSPAEFAGMIDSEIKRWKEVATAAKIKLD